MKTSNADIVKRLFKEVLRQDYFVHEINPELEIDAKHYEHLEKGDIVMFDKEEEYLGGYCEAFSIGKITYEKSEDLGKYLFSYRVDFGGTFDDPPSCDMNEDDKSYETFDLCLKALLLHVVEENISETFLEIQIDEAALTMQEEEDQKELFAETIIESDKQEFINEMSSYAVKVDDILNNKEDL